MLRHVVIGGLLLASGCGSPHREPSNGGEEITCPSGSANPGATIRTVNCSTVVRFDGDSLNTNLDVVGLGKAGIKHADLVLREVSQAAYDSQIQFTQTCELYNACNLTSAQYRERLDETQAHFRNIREKVSLLEAAKGNPAVLRQTLARLYDEAVPRPQAARNALAFEFTIQTRSGNGKVRTLRSGDVLRTGDAVVFGVRTSLPSYVYVFQRKPSGRLDVLFPNPGISVSNQLTPGKLVRLPPNGQSFRVNAEDVGEEVLYLAASRTPLSDLMAALARVTSDDPSGEQQVERAYTDLFSAAAPECTPKLRGLAVTDDADCNSLTRGLTLAPTATDDFFSEGASLKARSMPGDDVVLQTFRFVHVAE